VTVGQNDQPECEELTSRPPVVAGAVADLDELDAEMVPARSLLIADATMSVAGAVRSAFVAVFAVASARIV
jgi:hypothetical protein